MANCSRNFWVERERRFLRASTRLFAISTLFCPLEGILRFADLDTQARALLLELDVTHAQLGDLEYGTLNLGNARELSGRTLGRANKEKM